MKGAAVPGRAMMGVTASTLEGPLARATTPPRNGPPQSEGQMAIAVALAHPAAGRAMGKVSTNADLGSSDEHPPELLIVGLGRRVALWGIDRWHVSPLPGLLRWA